MFNADKPIKDVSLDLLNRASFSSQLAEAIISYDDSDNFTISICGKWGSGKTSILNMVEKFIEKKTENFNDESKPIIVHFNPWNYSDQSQLIPQFFSTMVSALCVHTKSDVLNNIGDVLLSYSAILEYTQYIPVAGEYLKSINKLANGLGKRLTKKNNNLNQKKKEVIEALEKQKHKFIVIIDDIDRLNNHQIKLIFQLVNSLADFPNVIYLLSFDKDVVVRALREEQNCNGEEYLEKIIQVPIDIPEAKGSSIYNVLSEKLNKLWVGEIKYIESEGNYWRQIFTNCIEPFVNSIRDVNRIINVYQFKYNMMHDEVNCIDLLAITVLQLYATNIYKWIYKNIDSICGSIYRNGISSVDQKKNYDKKYKEFENIYEKPELMITIIQTLFPRFSWQTGGYTHSSDTDDELRKNQKIACQSRAHLYFNLLLEDVVVSKNEIEESLKKYDEETFKSYLLNLIEKEKIKEYLKELIAYIPGISKDRFDILLNVLIDLLTNPLSYKNDGFLEISPSWYMVDSVWKIMKTYSKEEAKNKIIELLNMTSLDKFSIVINMIVQIECSYGRIGESSDYKYRIVSLEQLDEVEKISFKKLLKMSKTQNLFDAISFSSIYKFWRKVDQKSLKDYLIKALKEACNIPKYLKLIAVFWNSELDEGRTFKKDGFDGIISDKEAYDRIVSLKSTKQFSKLDNELKELSIAYALWYEKNDTDSKIGKTEIKKHFEEWEYAG